MHLTENQVKKAKWTWNLKTGFFIFCMRNKAKSIVLVVRNTSVEFLGQQCRFTEP